ncbi:MAG: hypothetical protein ABIY71_05250, partial [Flavobacteriales bacterium]
ILCGIGALSLSATAQNPRIVLQGTGEPQVFMSIDSAVAAAQPNDKLYFSGGTFTTGNGGITLDKPLHWIGAGISQDSTNVTALTMLRTVNGNFTFLTGAGGSSFTGIHFYPDGGNTFYGNVLQYGTTQLNDAPLNMVFERCSFQCAVKVGIPDSNNSVDLTTPGSSSSFNECIFTGGVTAWGLSATTFTRCDFASLVENFRPSGLFMDHCIARNSIVNCDGFLIKNSVLLSLNEGTFQSSGAMNNCLLVADVAGSGVGSNVTVSNNIYGQTGTIFVNDANTADFQWSDDLNLASGSPGIGAADDGTDIGIYGSASPFKAGAVPYNPHYRQATIATSTNPNGDLPVNIRVATQPN